MRLLRLKLPVGKTVTRLLLPIVLTPKQVETDLSPARFKILKWGRRTGKTWYIAYWIAKNALTKRGKHWYVTKTLSLGREELWPVLLSIIPRQYILKTDERYLSIRLTNGSVIAIKSGEKENNLRGRGLASVVLDEAAFLKESLWDRILRPQLANSRGPALIASSPKKGWFTRMFNDQCKNPHSDWFASHATIYDNPTISRDELEVIRAKTPDSTWRQEYLAEELAGVGQIYEEFSPKNVYNPAHSFLDIRSMRQIRGIDWGTQANTGVSWIGITSEGYLVVHGEHVQSGWDVERHVEAMNTKSAGLNVVDNVLDRSAFRNEGTSGTSIAELFRKQRIYCKESIKDIPSSIDAVKRFMRGDGVTPWLYVSDQCEKTIEAFQTWEHGEHEPDIAAACRYGVVWAVVKRLTRLADAIPILRSVNNDEKVSQATADLLLAAKAMVKPVGRSARWHWDMGAGCPI